MALFPGLPGWAGTRDSEWQWHQLGRMQVCTLLQIDNHASTPPYSFYRPDALPADQPTASKHWRLLHYVTEKKQCNRLLVITSRHGASRSVGLILIHCFPLSLLLFHSHRFLSLAICHYRLHTLLTLPWLPYTCFLPPFFSPSFFPLSPHLSSSLPTPSVYAYKMPIELLYRPVLHYSYIQLYSLYRLCYPRRRLRFNVRPTSQRRDVGPAALFSVDPDCCWRRLSRYFARRHFFINIFFL